jgi:hypothetical protein
VVRVTAMLDGDALGDAVRRWPRPDAVDASIVGTDIDVAGVVTALGRADEAWRAIEPAEAAIDAVGGHSLVVPLDERGTEALQWFASLPEGADVQAVVRDVRRALDATGVVHQVWAPGTPCGVVAGLHSDAAVARSGLAGLRDAVAAVPGVATVAPLLHAGAPATTIEVHREVAARDGATVRDIAATAALGEPEPTARRVVVAVPVDRVHDAPVRTATGTAPLSRYVAVRLGEPSIVRIDGQPAAVVGYCVEPDVVARTVMNRVKNEVERAGLGFERIIAE